MEDKYYGSVLQDIIRWHYPKVPMVCGETYSSLQFHDSSVSIPTIEECDKILIDYLEYVKTIEYKYKRKYPSNEEQWDLLFHKGYEGWKDHIQTIKNQSPKPSEG